MDRSYASIMHMALSKKARWLVIFPFVEKVVKPSLILRTRGGDLNDKANTGDYPSAA